MHRFEFDEAIERLGQAGYALVDREAAWRAFRDRRARYATPIRVLARDLVLPPARWLGDRSYLPDRPTGPAL